MSKEARCPAEGCVEPEFSNGRCFQHFREWKREQLGLIPETNSQLLIEEIQGEVDWQKAVLTPSPLKLGDVIQVKIRDGIEERVEVTRCSVEGCEEIMCTSTYGVKRYRVSLCLCKKHHVAHDNGDLAPGRKWTWKERPWTQEELEKLRIMMADVGDVYAVRDSGAFPRRSIWSIMYHAGCGQMYRPERGYYTPSNISALLGVSRKTVRKWINERKLPAERTERNRLVVMDSVFTQFCRMYFPERNLENVSV